MKRVIKWGLGCLLLLGTIFGTELFPLSNQSVEASPTKLVKMDKGPFKNNLSPNPIGDTPVAATSGKQGRDISGKNGSCLWNIDAAGILHIQAGTLDSNSTHDQYGGLNSPWYQYQNQITQISFEGKVISGSFEANLFAGFSNLIQVNNAQNFDVSTATVMSSMFTNCSSLTSIDVSNWDVSNATNLNAMFNQCNSLTKLDVSSWNTSNVTDLGLTFSGCSKLTSLDVSNWDISQVTTLSSTFANCSGVSNLDVSNWNTGRVTDMSNTFNACRGLTSIDVSGWDLSNAKTIKSMFSFCSKLNNIPFSNWNTSQVTDMSSFLNGCSSLTSVDVTKWNTSQVTQMGAMFADCTSLVRLDISTFDMSKLTYVNANGQNGIQYMLSGLTSLRVLKLGPTNELVLNTGMNPPTVDAILREPSGDLSGYLWRTVAGGTETVPKGTKLYSSAELMQAYNSGMADTYVLYDNPAGIDAHDSTISSGSTWKPQDNFVSVTDGDGNVYTDYGKIAKVDGSVDTNTPGAYNITYHYVDNFGFEQTKTVTVTVTEAPPAFSLDFAPESWDFGQHVANSGKYTLEKVNDATDTDQNQLRIDTQMTNYKLDVKYGMFTNDDKSMELTGATLELHNVALNNTDTGAKNVSGVVSDGNGNVSLASSQDYTPLISVANASADQKGNLVLQLGNQLSDVELNVPQKPQVEKNADANKATEYSSLIQWQLTNSL